MRKSKGRKREKRNRRKKDLEWWSDLASMRRFSARYQRVRNLEAEEALLRLAVAYAVSEEPDNAVAVAQQSLSIAANTRSQRIAGQLARVPGLLTTIGAGDQAKQLQRQLATLR